MIRECSLLLFLCLVLPGCGGGGSGGGSSGAPAPTVTTMAIDASIDGNSVAGAIQPLWRDHYDLSYTHLNYSGEAGFLNLAQSLSPRSWRCSVGRWEISIPAPAGGASMDPNVLRNCEREFYRGANTLAEADDPGNYDFTYLDSQLTALLALGVEPFLCFDYMPFTLSSQQNPNNGDNIGASDSNFSFSNGIRTAPPLDNAVYARVVRNSIRHVRGLFAGTNNFGVQFFEIGNEPDLITPNGTALKYFWSGDAAQFASMYAAIAAEVNADNQLSSAISLGSGSFAFLPGESNPRFSVQFLTAIANNSVRLDFLSYHSYDDDANNHLNTLIQIQSILQTLSINPMLVNGEWGRALDGADPVYDQIEHGLLRTRVMATMQLFGVQYAHEALFRDPRPGTETLGLIGTGPVAKKPVTDVYLALNKLNDTLQALPITTSTGNVFIAGKNSSNTKVVIVHVGEDPGAGNESQVNLTINNLPWGSANFTARRFVVSDASFAANQGVLLEDTQNLTGPSVDLTARIEAGKAKLIVWELERQ